MLNTIKRWLASPVFEDDEEKTRVARMLNTVLLSATLILAVYVFTTFKFFGQNPKNLIADLALIALLVSQLFFLRQGWVQTVSLILPSITWINLVIQAWLFGGVRDGSFTGHIIVILGATLLFSWRAGVGFLILSILAGLGLAHAEAIGILPFAHEGPYVVWFEQSSNFVLATILLTIAATSLNNALKRARHNEGELGKSNRELQSIQLSLETRTTELVEINQKL